MTRFGQGLLRHRHGGLLKAFVWLLVALMSGICHTASAQLTVENLLRSVVANPSAADFTEVADAINNFRGGRFDDARSLMIAAFEKDSRLAPPDVMMAQLYFSFNQASVGHGSLERAVKDHTADPEAYLIIADLARSQGRLAESGLAYKATVEIAESYTQNDFRKAAILKRAYNGAATVAEAHEDWDAAKKYLMAWVELDGRNPAPHVTLGRVQFKSATDMPGIKDAYKAFMNGYKLSENTTLRPEISMAQLYEQKGDRERAMDFFGKAIERNGDDLRTRLAASKWFIDTGHIQDAKESVDVALRIDPNSFDANFLSGLVARYQKEYDVAETAFRKVHQQRPANFRVINELALSLIERSDDPAKQNSALEWAQLTRLANPDVQQTNGREAMATLAWVLHKLGRNSEALRAVQSAVNGGTLGSEASYFAGKILAETPNTQLAQQLLQKAISAKAAFPQREDAEKLLRSL